MKNFNTTYFFTLIKVLFAVSILIFGAEISFKKAAAFAAEKFLS